MKTVLVSAVALIDKDKRILLAQRPEGKAMAGLWEFPGGKMETGELPENALIREIKEEIGVELCHSCLTSGPFASYVYSNEPRAQDPGCDCPVDNHYFVPAHALGLKAEFHLLMMLYLCRKWVVEPRPREGQALAWYKLSEMHTLAMPPADRPLVAALQDMI